MGKNTVITISREYGSGGRLIGQKLAESLHIPLYDHDIITLSAKRSGIDAECFKSVEAIATSSFLFSTSNLAPSGGIFAPSINEKLFQVQSDIIKELAQKGSCVIVGRCADYVLRENPDVLNVFIFADKAFRTDRIIKAYELSSSYAEDKIKKTDKNRATYYNFFTNRKWGQAKNYHLIVNSSHLGFDNAVELIKTYLQLKYSDNP